MKLRERIGRYGDERTSEKKDLAAIEGRLLEIFRGLVDASESFTQRSLKIE
jgi:hypothetical protein